MSIRTNPMKAVPVLLKRVNTARRKFMERERDESFDGKLEKLTRELNKIEDVFVKVKKNQDALLDALHDVDSHLRKLDRRRLDQDMDGICRRIRDCTRKLLPMDAFDDDSCDELSGEIVHSSSHDPSLTQPNNQLLQFDSGYYMSLFIYPVHRLQTNLKILGKIFPKGAVIKKRQAIYLWIGLGLTYSIRDWTDRSTTTNEEDAEDAIDKLLRVKGIVAYGNGKCPIVNKFQLNRKFLRSISPCNEGLTNADSAVAGSTEPHYDSTLLKQQKVTLDHDVKSKQIVFNVGASHLNFVSKWLGKGNSELKVLQLGRWQDSPTHHIEVGSQEFLKDLTNQKELRYLSLRGISRIFQLPPSIAQIKSLKILDLKACHNLETLPDDISSMKSLTHLILSQCYLLDGMPKGIDKLTDLQVLKGFIIGSSRDTPSRISDLANLKNLRRLSIRIRPEAVINVGEFEILGDLSELQHLKISWGVSDTRFSDIRIILPSSLKKLHLECFPEQKIPEWLKPSKLPWELELPSTSSRPQQLKELKITGGNLKSMNHDEDMNGWSMKIVRLRYLRNLEVDITTLQELFPLLQYAEIRKISNHSYFEWSTD